MIEYRACKRVITAEITIQYADCANKAGKACDQHSAVCRSAHAAAAMFYFNYTLHCVHYSNTVKYASVYAVHDVFVTNNIKIITM